MCMYVSTSASLVGTTSKTVRGLKGKERDEDENEDDADADADWYNIGLSATWDS